MRRIVASALKARGLVIALAVVVTGVGVMQLRNMPRDVLPEFSRPTVEVQTEALGLSSLEVEQLITVPLEQDLLNGVAFLDAIRSQSVAGMSSIQLVFKPGTDLFRARLLVNERLTQAHALPNVSKPPQMLQPLSSESRVMMIRLSSKTLSLIDLGVLTRWTIRPRLMGIRGVAGVAVWGQEDRQLQVQVDPQQLAAKGVSLDQVISTTGNALWWSPLSRLEANTPGTGGFAEGPNQRLGIFHESPIKTPKDLGAVAIEEARTPVSALPGTSVGQPAGEDGQPLALSDVAKVVEDHQPLIGSAVFTDGPGLMLVIEKLPGANVTDVTHRVDKTLQALTPGLAGVKLDASTFRPASYIDRSLHNLLVPMIVGFCLLLALLLVFSFDWRTTIISGIAVVMSVSAAGFVLYLRGAALNHMVLAGLVLALVVLVDDAVVDIDHLRRRRRREPESNGNGSGGPLGSTVDASVQMRSPLGYATVIVLLTLLPILVLTGEIGAFLPSLVLSYAAAVVASTAVALVITPILSLLLLPKAPERRESPLVRWLHRSHDKVFPSILRSWRTVFCVFAAMIVVGMAALPFAQRGKSLAPSFKDTNLLIHWDAVPGTSLSETSRIMGRASHELQALPGVRDVGGHVGRAEMGDQVVGSNSGEMWVRIDAAANYDTTTASIRRVVDGYPGLKHSVRTYPQERIGQVLGKTSRDITVRVYGHDPALLQTVAADVRQALAEIRGIDHPSAQLDPQEPTFEVKVDLAAAARYDVKPGDVRRAAATLVSGLGVGALFEEQKVFDVVVWGESQTRNSINDVRDLLIDTPSGGHVRLGDVAQVRVASVPSVVRHEDVSRFVDVTADVRGRSVASAAGAVEARLQSVKFPQEFHAELRVGYAKRHSAQLRFLGLCLASVIGVLLLMQAAFGSWRLASLILFSLPAALVGGVLGLLVDGGTLTLGSLTGFLALLAIAVRTCLILVRRCQDLETERPDRPRLDVVLQATRERLVPTLMSATGTAVLLLPLIILGDRAGAEIAHPLAVVVLGGLVTASLLNLVVVPALYLRFAARPTAAGDVSPPSLPVVQDDHRVDDGAGKFDFTTTTAV